MSQVGKSNQEIFNPELDEWVKDYIAADNDAEKNRLTEKIVTQVMPYVRKIAYGLARRSSDPVEDLIQMGNIGLIKAIGKYNPLMGSSFKTYSTYFITGEIRHYLRDKTSMIKAPRQMYELYYRMNQIVQKLTDELQRTPTDEEIANELECSVSQVIQAQNVERRRTPVSLDQFQVGSDSGSDVMYLEKLVDDKYFEVAENNENKIVIDDALAHLKDELKVVVKMTFYEDMSQTQIAEKLGISQMQVSRRLRKALDLLNKNLSASGFQDN